MVDKLGNLDNAVSDLESQVESIKKFTHILDKIKKISNDIDDVSKNVTTHARSFVDISHQMGQKINQIDLVFQKNESQLNEVENNILERLKQSNILLNNRYEKLHNDSNNILTEAEKRTSQLTEIENNMLERLKQSNLLLNNRYEKLHNDSNHILIETEKRSRELGKIFLDKTNDIDANLKAADQLLESNIIKAIEEFKLHIDSSINVIIHQQKKHSVIQNISSIVLVILLAAVLSGLNL